MSLKSNINQNYQVKHLNLFHEVCVKDEKLVRPCTFFYDMRTLYKNVEAEIDQIFKNMLRTYPRLRVGERLYFAHLF